MILTIEEWFGSGRQLLPPEDPEEPGRWMCKRCDGGEMPCAPCVAEPNEHCKRCYGYGFVTCDACSGLGYHKTQKEAREA